MRLLNAAYLILALGFAGCSSDSAQDPGFLGSFANARTSDYPVSAEAEEVIQAYFESISSAGQLGLTGDAVVKDKFAKNMRKYMRLGGVLSSTDKDIIYPVANSAVSSACLDAGIQLSAAQRAKLGLVACSHLTCTDEQFTSFLQANINGANIPGGQKEAFMAGFMPEFMAGAPDRNAAAVAQAVSSIAEILGAAPDATLAEMAKHARSEKFLAQAMAGSAEVMTKLGFSQDQITSVFSAVQESAAFQNSSDQSSLLNTLRQTVQEQTGSSQVADIFASVANAFSDVVAGVVAAITANGSKVAPAINFATSTLNLTVGVAMTSIDPADGTFSGASGKSCAISPVLPAGLSLNTSSCVISGTPTSASAQATYTITVTDANGTGTDEITIAVVRPAFSTSFDLTSAGAHNCDGIGSCAGNSDNINFSSGGTVSLNALDLKTDTAAEWTATGATLSGVTTSSNTLTLNSTTNAAWTFNASWTPQFDYLAVYYNFEGSGSSIDNVAGSSLYDGAFGGDAARDTQAAVAGSKGVSFDGDGDYIDTGYIIDGTGNKDFTFMIWQKMDAALGDGEYVYVMGATNTSDPYDLFESKIVGSATDTGRFQTLRRSLQANNGGVNSTTNTIGDQNWHHYAAVFDADGGSDALTIYVDGFQEASGSFPDYDKWNLGSLPLMLGGTNLNGSLWNSHPFAGDVDEFAVWETALTADEVARIYQRQKVPYSGTYTSKVFDVGSSGDLTTIAFETPLPFGKNLPATAETTSAYSDIQASSGSSTLQNGLMAYFNFDGDVSDGLPDVSANSHDGTVNGTLYSGRPGVIGKAWEFGSGNTTHGDITLGGAITVSAWILRDTVKNQHATIVSEGDDGEWDLQFEQLGDCIRLNFDDGGGWEWTVSNMHCITDGEWVHIVYMRDSSFAGNDYVIYADGVQVQSSNWLDGASIADNAGSHDLQIGGRVGGARRFSGLIDEVGIWNRGLTAAEVLELYRRGANRMSVVARTCSDATCSTNPAWVGSGGFQTGLSEWHNNSTIGSGNATGTTNITGPFFLFSDFVSPPNAHRYWQYRVTMESLDDGDVCAGSSRCNPVLKNLSLHKRVGDAVGGAEVAHYAAGYFVNGTPVSYHSLTSINITDSGTCKYQASPDGGTTFYYKTGGSWATVSSDTNANTSGDTAWNNLSGFPAGSGNLVIKAIMGGAGAPCSITGIQVNGLN